MGALLCINSSDDAGSAHAPEIPEAVLEQYEQYQDDCKRMRCRPMCRDDFVLFLATRRMSHEPVEPNPPRGLKRVASGIDDGQPSTTPTRVDKHLEACAICMETQTNPCSVSKEGTEPCDHTFCSQCIEQWTQIKSTCPLCRSPSNILPLNKDPQVENFHYYTKQELCVPLDIDTDIETLIPTSKH